MSIGSRYCCFCAEEHFDSILLTHEERCGRQRGLFPASVVSATRRHQFRAFVVRFGVREWIPAWVANDVVPRTRGHWSERQWRRWARELSDQAVLRGCETAMALAPGPETFWAALVDGRPLVRVHAGWEVAGNTPERGPAMASRTVEAANLLTTRNHYVNNREKS
jgi:hypothetical protein